MSVASLVIGIISFFVALVPLCGYVALIPAVTGLILGIIFIVQSKKQEGVNTGTAVAGIVFNALALLILAAYTVIFAVIGGSKDSVKQLFDDVISDSARVEHDSVKKEIEKEMASDSSSKTPNPFDMGGTDADAGGEEEGSAIDTAE